MDAQLVTLEDAQRRVRELVRDFGLPVTQIVSPLDNLPEYLDGDLGNAIMIKGDQWEFVLSDGSRHS